MRTGDELTLKQMEEQGRIYHLDLSKLKRFRFGLWPWSEPSANPLAKSLNRGSENE